jgi:hypothetical protein
MQKMSHPILQLLIKNKWIFSSKIFPYVCIEMDWHVPNPCCNHGWWILCGENNEKISNFSQV